MAFLTINGIDVTTRYGGQCNTQLQGKGIRSISGNMLRDVRSIKREWRFSTTPMTQAAANALIGMINGLGHHFNMDSDAVSDGGLTPTSGYTGAVHHGANAADGDPQKLIYTAPATTGNLYIKSSAIWCAEATTNELTKAQSDADETGGATTDFDVYATATIATNTTHYWQGSRSIKVTTTSGGDGIQTDTLNADPEARASEGETFTFSVWVKGDSSGDATVTPLIQWRTAADGHISSTPGSNFTATQNEWRRIWVTGTAPATTDHFRVRVTASGAGDIFYVDGLMATQTASVAPWVVGPAASARAEIAPLYSTAVMPSGTTSATFAFWSNGSARADAGTSAGIAFRLFDGTNYWRSYVTSGGAAWYASHYDGSVITNTLSTTTPTFGVWHHIVGTLDHATLSQSLYIDGTLEDSDTVNGSWDLGGSTSLLLGEISAQNLNGAIDQFMLLPYALTAAQVSDLYNSGTPETVTLPKLTCSGDFVPDSTVSCFGEVTGIKYTGVTLSGSHNNNAVVVDFKLMEV